MSKSRTEIKQIAQDLIMHLATTAYYHVDDMNESEDDKNEIAEEIKKQINRIEKLFGYEINSWRGA